MEGNGEEIKLLSGATNSLPPVIIGSFPLFIGTESMLFYASSSGRYYFIRDKQFMEYDPEKQRVRAVIEDQVRVLAKGPRGTVVYTTINKKV